MHKSEAKFDIRQLILLILCSYWVGAYLFFHNPWFDSLFINLNSADFTQYPYLEFSQQIFHRRYYENPEHWWVESLLFPLSVKIIGASKSIIAFKIFSSLLTISFLPAITIGYLQVSRNIYASFLLLIFMSLFYGGLYDFQVDFPDSLLVIFLGLAAIQRKSFLIFVYILLAGLTHFSITLFSSLALSIMMLSRTNDQNTSTLNKVVAVFLGLLSAWLTIQLWLWLFNSPNHLGRFNWAINAGFIFFKDRYLSNPDVFWITPKLPLIVSSLALIIYFLVKRKFLVAFGGLCAIAISYVCHFFTVDGYRVFINVYCGPFIFLVTTFLNSIHPLSKLQK